MTPTGVKPMKHGLGLSWLNILDLLTCYIGLVDSRVLQLWDQSQILYYKRVMIHHMPLA